MNETSVYIHKQSDCNLSNMPKTKELSKDTRGKLVHMNQSISKQLGAKKTTVIAIMRKLTEYKITNPPPGALYTILPGGVQMILKIERQHPKNYKRGLLKTPKSNGKSVSLLKRSAWINGPK